MSLRERKKALTRTAIEDAGLRLYVQQGYEQTTIDDICEAVLVSRRTFFRYFSSKEDVVLSVARADFARAAEQLRGRPAGEPVRQSLSAMYEESLAFAGDQDRALTRARLLARTPALAGSYFTVLTDFERMLRHFLAERMAEPADGARVRLLAAATVTAFRVAVEAWADSDNTIVPAPLAHENLEQLLAGWSPPVV